MSYFELLHLDREPFSNSPDPGAYCALPQHEDCLNRMEIAIRLKRGLNVVTGMVGTGKSTLCRCLLRALDGQKNVEAFLMLDAGFADGRAFFLQLFETITGRQLPPEADVRSGMAALQDYLYEKTQTEGKTVALFIDEGQKLSPDALEVLRELLNFETNTEKMLQIVIFAQPELEEVIAGIPNVKDRINELLRLERLSEQESIDMIRHRLRYAGGQSAERLFSAPALRLMHVVSGGRPRQLVRLGHQMLLALIMGNASCITAEMVRAQAERDGMPLPAGLSRRAALASARTLAAGLLLAASVLWPTPLYETEGPQPAPAASPDAAALPASVPSPAVSDALPATDALPPTPEPSRPALLGTLKTDGSLPLADIALAFYGTKAMEKKLREYNPDYRQGSAGTVRLPEQHFPIPDMLCTNVLISYGYRMTPADALRARNRLCQRKARNVRIVARELDGSRRFFLLSRESFSTPQRAVLWLGKQPPLPAGFTAVVMPPFTRGTQGLYYFHELQR
ncbi:MAG: AAA family ATPase [Desulfovibrionaceae bacterium]|nr:AAA family ATPase [Desulfovibrionaceae bacterium]